MDIEYAIMKSFDFENTFEICLKSVPELMSFGGTLGHNSVTIVIGWCLRTPRINLSSIVQGLVSNEPYVTMSLWGMIVWHLLSRFGI